MKPLLAKGCLAAGVLLVLLAGFLFWRWKTPPRVAENFKELPSAEKTRRRQDARRLEEQVQEVARHLKRGDRAPFRVTASQQQLNTLLQDRINTDKAPIRDLRVGLQNQQLTLQGNVLFKGMQTTITLVGAVSVQQGQVAYNIDSMLLGGLFNAPKKWRRKVESQVSLHLNKLLADQNVALTRAAVENEQLVIEGAPR